MALILSSPQPMFICWGSDRITLFNDAYRPILGQRVVGAIGLPLDQLWAEVWEDIAPIVTGTLAGSGATFSDLPLLMTRNGYRETTWWSSTYMPFRDANGQIRGLLCTMTEATAQVKALAALRESEMQLDALIRSSSEVLYRISADWGELQQLTGSGFIADTSAANRNWLDEYIPAEDRPAVRAEFERAIRTKSTYNLEHRVNRVDGTVGWALSRAVPLFGAKGEVTGWLGAASDVTDRRRAEAALRALNATLAEQVQQRTQERNGLWEVSRDLFMVADADGVILSVNPAWVEALGWEEGEFLGRTSEWLEHPDDRGKTRREIADLAAGRTTLSFENRFRTKAGEYRQLSWTAVPAGGLLYCSARDVTNATQQAVLLSQAEDTLRQSQKMEAVGQLTGGVAHDFNNLLTVIRSSADLLRRSDLSEERRSRYVSAIADTVDRAAKLTGQLLAFARRQALRPEVFDAATSVRNISEMISTLAGSRIRIILELAPEPCFINADPSQFDTAIVNMAVNARDAMNGQGQLTISVGPAEGVPAVRSHPAAEGAFVKISITDTGSGIAPKSLERIFEPFFTTKGVGEGTGLGLSQVYGFAKQSGGEVVVLSELGRGTTFRLYLPRAEAAKALVAKEESPLVSDGGGACVLVVEDNRDVGLFVTQSLAELGYTTNWVTNAQAALDELAAHPTAHEIVFSDVIMPGMNGVELGREIGRLYPDLPVILTSGYSHVLAQDAHHGFELLQKPYSIEGLAKVLSRVVDKRLRRVGPL